MLETTARSQIQRYVRPRFAEPIENATRINNNRNKRIKLKKLLPEFKNVEMEKNGRVVRNMTVTRRSTSPSSKRKREYKSPCNIFIN